MENSPATHRAEMPVGSSPVLDIRRLETDNKALMDILIPGDKVLDVGCGSGPITKGIADVVGPYGKVIGIDSSDHLVASASKRHKSKNLQFKHIDLFDFQVEESFDVITSARTLQWLENPKEALKHMYGLLKPGGCICILDYNHTKLAWSPEPPKSMKEFYRAFLKWRKDAGMDNQMADKLAGYFKEFGLRSVHISLQHEFYQRGAANFDAKINIWTKVAESRGKQLVADGYITEDARLKTIEEYKTWAREGAQSMKMYLLAVSGYK